MAIAHVDRKPITQPAWQHQASDGAVKTGETHLLRRARRTIRHVAGGVLKELERAVGRCDADLGSIPIYSPSTILHFLAILAETFRVD
jgi:hypothetical protein